MTLSQILVLLVLFVPLAFVLWGKLRLDAAALSSAALLGILQFCGLGILGPANTPGDALKSITGFSQPAVITLLGLFVLTSSLDKTGVPHWVAQRITRIGGRSEARLVLLFTGATALFSLLMNNVAAGALLLPGVLETTRRTGIRPSKLLIPVAFGSLLGGMATYFTTANIIASDLLGIAQPPQHSLNMLHFLPTGGLIAIVGILYLTLVGPRLLPERETVGNRLVREVTGRELEDYYRLGERLWELQIQSGSLLAGQTLAEVDLGKRFGVSIPLIWRGHQTIISPTAGERLRPGDTLLVIGREERVNPLLELGLIAGQDLAGRLLSAQGIKLAELIVAPHSSAIGKTLKELDFRQRQGLTAVALRRGERSYRTDVGDLPLALGDTLLVVGNDERIKALRSHPSFFLVEATSADQPVDRRRALLAVLVTLLAIGASIAGVPTYLAVFSGALLLVISRILTMEAAYQAMEWSVIFQIAGMVAVSQAMVQTGLSKLIGDSMLQLAAPLGPIGLAGGAFMLAALLTQFMGGQVTALVVGPVTISAAISLGVNPQAIAVATAIGCSAAFLTPMAHPVNILMMTPGNYRFGDFFRIGWVLLLICFGMLLLGMKLFWGLS